jgi:hypothetical protein
MVRLLEIQGLTQPEMVLRKTTAAMTTQTMYLACLTK